jgi:hypothetical protein
MKTNMHLIALALLIPATGIAVAGQPAHQAAASSLQSTNHANHDHAAHQAEMGRASPERQAEVARRGRPVMGFDLDRTRHHFAPTANGGVLTVTSRDGDAAQVRRVRSHLNYQAKAFQRGDWANPVQIHGAEMPGLSALMAARGNLKIQYRTVVRGGRITFVSKSRDVTSALHRWFDAQNRDHGKHAGQ